MRRPYKSEVEEHGLAIDPHRDRNAASAVGRDDRLNLFRDDLFNVGLRERRRGAERQCHYNRKDQPHESSELSVGPALALGNVAIDCDKTG